MERWIQCALQNFTITLLLLSVLWMLLALMVTRKTRSKEQIIDTCFSTFLLFNIGISYLYNFVIHVFFGEIAAQFIGWAQSPFQLEVGFASLGFAALGVISYWSNLSFRAATVIAPALFLWGAAGGHIYQIIVTHNMAAGNAGAILWTDILLPVVGFILLALQSCYPLKATGSA
ncbi:MAG: hypothetical protein Q8R79_09185 [Legionellaceae bacterium]|nr:hypothetical protein [Legionellaceae bacterium]